MSAPSSSKTSRYAWGPVRSNRHKTNKRNAVTEAHLLGRLALLELDQEELTAVFGPEEHLAVRDDIAAEIQLITEEITLREAPVKPKKAKKVVQELPSLDGMEALAALASSWDEEDDSEVLPAAWWDLLPE